MGDRHVVEVAGCRAVIEHGTVTKITEPVITFCPFAKRFASPINPVTAESVRKNIEHRMASFGMCTPDRQVLATESMVLFGASELLTTALRNGTLDAAVIACDGAGTVIVRTPELIQGIGGRMSGLVSTVPYPEVIKRIEDAGGIVIDKEHAALDAAAGVAAAKRRGFTRIAVTVAGCGVAAAESIRKKWPDTCIIAVHTSFVQTKEEADRLFAACDLVFACASKHVRDAAAESACVQGGVGVPVFAASKEGKRIILERLMETNEPFLVKNMKLPVCDMGKQPDPLV
ncbi:MAG TPA: DUF2099 family protein [Methanocorpusculum sp.]|nr:DUF2099 family protein [Methanocorpusculum sp.]